MEFAELDLNRAYNYAEYLKWTFEERVELIKGKIFKMSPAPNLSHARISRAIFGSLYNHLKGNKCEAFAAPFDVRFPNKNTADKEVFTVLQPDVVVVCDPSKLDEKGCIGAPDLVVEVLSPGNSLKEQKFKFEIYQESGVKEYWVVDPLQRCVTQYNLVDAKLITSRPLFEGDTIYSTAITGFELTLDEVFEGVA